MEIQISSLFYKHYKKLPKKIQEKAQNREKVFRKNPFDPRLKTHKLHGEKKEEWAFSVDYSYRVSFVFAKDDCILFTDIGTHDQLY